MKKGLENVPNEGSSGALRVVLVGGAGHMLGATAHALMSRLAGVELVLLDRDQAALDRRTREPGLERARSCVVDLWDAAALRRQLKGARIVIHGAGPFRATARPIRSACLELGIDYLDLDDEPESTREALALNEAARRAGVRLFVGCGVSPGLTNLLAQDALSELETVERIEVAWCVGEDAPIGRAVAEHALLLGAGECVAIEDGMRVVRPSMQRSSLFDLQLGLPPRRLYEMAHPEPEQLAYSHPDVRDIVCWGGLNPAPMNGLLKGLARAAREGSWSTQEACAFLEAASRGKLGSPRGWKHALSGLAAQWRSGELRCLDLLQLAAPHRPGSNAICAQVTGLRGAERITVTRQLARTQARGPDTTMARATGLAAAAFVCEALQASSASPGTLFPQMWASPERIYAAMQRLGATEIVIGWRAAARAVTPFAKARA